MYQSLLWLGVFSCLFVTSGVSTETKTIQTAFEKIANAMGVKEITEDMDVRIRYMIASGLGFKAIGKNIGVSYRLVMTYCESNGLIERNEYGKINVRDYKPGSFKNCGRCKFRLNCAEKEKNAFRCGKYSPDYKLIQERIDRNRMIRDWNERDNMGGV